MAQTLMTFSTRLFDNGKGGLDTVLPPGVMDALGVKEGDFIQFAITADGKILASKAVPPATTKSK